MKMSVFGRCGGVLRIGASWVCWSAKVSYFCSFEAERGGRYATLGAGDLWWTVIKIFSISIFAWW